MTSTDSTSSTAEETVEVLANGEALAVPQGATVADVADRLLEGAGGAERARGVAVAVDDEVVPRGAWSSTPVAAGARVEVLHVVAGG
ncbi:sulfur carrier protein ThiS [uncultured Pseudokineococcus sp.]|uniref:sulfur carrier protein ThiS n=1 Tax=uncultured Pseudokineococcus sp. TaxID=1642928 RepID=UPI002607EBA6|nr:sulfur carrier protein ThiS [uncultured Pseudokineococcus sp.]